MRRLILVLLLSLTLAGVSGARADEVAEVAAALEAQQPAAIERQAEQLFVVLPQRQVRPEMLSTAVTLLCIGHESGKLPAADFAELVLLNQFGRQGFVYEGGLDICAELMDLEGQLLHPVIMGHSRVY